MYNVLLGTARCLVGGKGQRVHNSHFLLDSKCHEAKINCVVQPTHLTTDLKGLAQSKQTKSVERKCKWKAHWTDVRGQKGTLEKKKSLCSRRSWFQESFLKHIYSEAQARLEKVWQKLSGSGGKGYAFDCDAHICFYFNFNVHHPKKFILKSETSKKHRGYLGEGLVIVSLDSISAGSETTGCRKQGPDLTVSLSRKVSTMAVERGGCGGTDWNLEPS